MKRQLTEREQEALTWARRNYKSWRKRWSESLTAHMAAMTPIPTYYTGRARQQKRLLWLHWYYFPFGEPSMNINGAIVRRLLKNKLV